MGKFQTYLASVAVLIITTVGAWAQSSLSVLQAEAEAALIAGDAATTAALSRQLLARAPDSYAGHFLLALALSELNDHAAAAQSAGRAYRVAPTESDKLQAARLAGSARFDAGHFARSELWLRRAANHIISEEDAQRVVLEFRRAQNANPLSMRFGASVTPSDNINNGAENETFRLEDIDIDFFLPPDRLALSGIEFAGEAQFGYRISQGPKQQTSVGAYFFARTYTLSDESQATVPELSGSDFALGLIDFSLTQNRLIFDALGPTSGSFHIGRVWYSGDAVWSYRSVNLAQVFPIGTTAALTLRGEIEDQQSLIPSQADLNNRSFSATVGTTRENGDGVNTSFVYTFSDGGFENVFREYSTQVRYLFDEPIWGMRWSLDSEIGYRNYDAFPTTLDGRRDRFASVGATVIFENIAYWGFSPSLSMSTTRTVSSAEEFTSNVVEGQLGVQSNF